MGLDTVELCMSFEDEFRLHIPDEDAERLQTPGQVTEYVLRRLRERARPAGGCRSARSFYRLRRELQTRIGLPPRAVRPASRIGDLLPDASRSAWPAVARVADLRPEPFNLFHPIASRFPPPDTTVRDLIHTRLRDDEAPQYDGPVDEEAVWLTVRRLTAGIAGVSPEEVEPDMHFGRDLGLD